MPNRDLKDSNRRSASLQLLSDASERLWYRLITAVDDFGRMEADPEVVFTTCFQRVPKGWTLIKVEKCLQELSTFQAVGQEPLIHIYQAGTKLYLQIVSAANHIYKRAKESKYPDPVSSGKITVAHRCAQVRADSLDLRTPNPDIPNPDFKPVRADDVTGSRFQEFWQAYPERNGKKLEKAATDALFRKLSIQDQALAVLSARNYAEALKAQGISAKDPKRFFKDDYWREWITPAKPDPVRQHGQARFATVTPLPKAYQLAPRIEGEFEPPPPGLMDVLIGRTMSEA